MAFKVNAKKLDEWISNTEDGMSVLMSGTGLSFYTIDRMRRGKYVSSPNKSTRNALCAKTDLKMDVLFPPVTAGRTKAS